MRLNFLLLFFIFFLGGFSLHPLQGESHEEGVLRIPLGFSWGDPPSKLEELTRGGAIEIVGKESPNTHWSKEIVHGILGNALLENNFFFEDDALVGIEYEYGNPTWEESRYEEFFQNFRRLYDRKYGEGSLMVSLKDVKDEKEKGITYSLEGYQWSQSTAILQLYYFSAKEGKKSYSSVSLYYKAP